MKHSKITGCLKGKLGALALTLSLSAIGSAANASTITFDDVASYSQVRAQTFHYWGHVNASTANPANPSSGSLYTNQNRYGVYNEAWLDWSYSAPATDTLVFDWDTDAATDYSFYGGYGQSRAEIEFNVSDQASFSISSALDRLTGGANSAISYYLYDMDNSLYILNYNSGATASASKSANESGLLSAGNYRFFYAHTLWAENTSTSAGDTTLTLQAISVPEPYTVALLLTGIAGFGFSTKRKRA